MDWITQLHGAVVGLDTAAIIYYVEGNPQYLPAVDPFFDALDQGEFEIVTSMISLTETFCLCGSLTRRITQYAIRIRHRLLDTAVSFNAVVRNNTPLRLDLSVAVR